MNIEYDNCRTFKEHIICEIFHFKNKTLCELKHFKQERNGNECSREILKEKSIITPINTDTFYVCKNFMFERIEITVTCKENIITLNLSDHILFKLEPGCTLFGLNRQYIAPQDYKIGPNGIKDAISLRLNQKMLTVNRN